MSLSSGQTGELFRGRADTEQVRDSDLRRLETETREVNVLVLQSKDKVVENVLRSKHNNSDGGVC